jgi:hypothetical protein
VAWWPGGRTGSRRREQGDREGVLVQVGIFGVESDIPPAAGDFQQPKVVRVVDAEDFVVVRVVRRNLQQCLEEPDPLEMFVDRDKAFGRFRVFKWGGVEQIVRMVDIDDVFHRDPGE